MEYDLTTASGVSVYGMGKNDPCSYKPASLTLVTREEAVSRLEEVLGRRMEMRPQEKKPLSLSFGPAQDGLNMRRKISIICC